jgi:hypothetical protein
MSELNKEYPKNPKVRDCVIVTMEAHCGCIYNIRCQWNGKYWMYISDQWCKPHGSYGKLIEVKIDDGKPLSQAPQNPILKILDYEKDTNGRIPAGMMRSLTGTR